MEKYIRHEKKSGLDWREICNEGERKDVEPKKGH